jgi:hypothetical protein
LKIKRTPHGTLRWYCPACDQNHAVEERRYTFNEDFEKPTIYPAFTFRRGTTVCESYISQGLIQYTDQCTHEMRGQVVRMMKQM